MRVHLGGSLAAPPHRGRLEGVLARRRWCPAAGSAEADLTLFAVASDARGAEELSVEAAEIAARRLPAIFAVEDAAPAAQARRADARRGAALRGRLREHLEGAGYLVVSSIEDLRFAAEGLREAASAAPLGAPEPPPSGVADVACAAREILESIESFDAAALRAQGDEACRAVERAAEALARRAREVRALAGRAREAARPAPARQTIYVAW